MKHDFENDRHSIHCITIDDELNRDTVMFPTQGDGISVFCGESEVQRIAVQVSYLTICKDQIWMYAGVSTTGDLVLIDYKTYEERDRYKLAGKRATGIWYHHKTSALIVGFVNEFLQSS
jgi:hypothetical protein